MRKRNLSPYPSHSLGYGSNRASKFPSAHMLYNKTVPKPHNSYKQQKRHTSPIPTKSSISAPTTHSKHHHQPPIPQKTPIKHTCLLTHINTKPMQNIDTRTRLTRHLTLAQPPLDQSEIYQFRPREVCVFEIEFLESWEVRVVRPVSPCSGWAAYVFAGGAGS